MRGQWPEDCKMLFHEYSPLRHLPEFLPVILVTDSHKLSKTSRFDDIQLSLWRRTTPEPVVRADLV